MTEHPTTPTSAQPGQPLPGGDPQPQIAGAPYGAPPDPYARPDQPMKPGDERNLGLLAHLIPLVALWLSAGFLGFVASLVVYLYYKDRGPFVRAHAANSLNVQIVTGIGVAISYVLMFVLIGFVTIFFVLAFATVLHIIGAVKASKGEWWKPPMTPSFVS